MIILAEFDEILRTGNKKAIQNAVDWMNILLAKGEELPFPFDAREISAMLKADNVESPLFNKDGIYVCSVPKERKYFYDNVKYAVPQEDAIKEAESAWEEEQEI